MKLPGVAKLQALLSFYHDLSKMQEGHGEKVDWRNAFQGFETLSMELMSPVRKSPLEYYPKAR